MPCGAAGRYSRFAYGTRDGIRMTFQTSDTQATAPGCAWYILALIALLLGIGGAVGWMMAKLPQLGDRLTQVVVPGEATLRLTEPGTYTIFHERRSVIDGRVYSSDRISGLRISLRNAQGERVPLSSPGVSSTYNLSGRSGAAIFSFEIKDAGTYRLTAAYDDGRAGPRVVLAVGTGFMAGLMATVFGTLAFAFAGIIAAIVIFVLVFRRRRRARQAAPQSEARSPTVS